MTGSGEQRQRQTVHASGAVTGLPPALTFVVNIQLPAHVSPSEFKATHRRKNSFDSETPKASSPVPSTSSQSLASSIDSIACSLPERKVSSAKGQYIVQPVKQQQKRPAKSVVHSRPKSVVFEIPGHRFTSDSSTYRPRSVPVFEQRAYSTRTRIRHDNSGFSRGVNGKSAATAAAGAGTRSPSQQKAPTIRRSVPAPVAVFVPLDRPPTQKPITNSLGSAAATATAAAASTSNNARLVSREQAEEANLRITMVGATEQSSEEKSANTRILIKGGHIVNDDAISVADVFLEDGIIKQVGPNLAVPGGARVVEAKGKYVMPGGIDTNTNFQLPFMGTTSVDDFYSGTKAALAGGTTMIMGNVLPQRGESLLSALEKWRGWADSKVCCDYGLSVAVPHWSEKVGEEMAQVTSKGINSFQFFMNYKDAYMLRDDELYGGFQQCKRVGALARVHAENGDLIAAKQKEILSAGVTGPEGHLQAHPEEAEIEATARACILARQANCPVYIMQVMGKGAADAIGDAKRKGSVVYGESVVAGLFTDGNNYFNKSWRHAASFVMSPPLRIDPTTPKYLTQLLASGDLNLAVSAHCAYNSGQKLIGKDDFTKIPHGVNGVEERMMVVWERGVNSGRIDMMRFVAVTSTNAAKIFNIYPKKGRIAEGSDADIVLWDPDSAKTLSVASHNSQTDTNIFEGLTCRGVPYITIAAGKVVFEDGQLRVTEGSGKFVPLPSNSPQLFASISTREFAQRPVRVDRDAAAVDSGKAPVGNGPTNTNAASPPPYTSPEPPYMEPLMPATSKRDEFHARPITKAGSRHLQDSTFSISGTQVDEDQGNKRSTRISKPPGGESRGLW